MVGFVRVPMSLCATNGKTKTVICSQILSHHTPSDGGTVKNDEKLIWLEEAAFGRCIGLFTSSWQVSKGAHSGAQQWPF